MRASLSITGLPEFPPMMSLVVTKFILVLGFSALRAFSQDCGSANGARPVARSKSPAKSVNGATLWPRSS